MKDIIKTLSLLFLTLVALSNTIYAKEKTNTEGFVLEYNFEEDEFSGPGIGIAENTWNGAYGIVGDNISSVVYNAFGPGFMVSAFSRTLEENYVDMGPQAIDAIISPDSHYKVITATPKELAETCVPLNNAKSKDSKKSNKK